MVVLTGRPNLAQSASQQILIECCWELGLGRMKENSKACPGPGFAKLRLVGGTA